MTIQTDPRISAALEKLATVGNLLEQSARIMRSAAPGTVPRLDLVERGLAQAHHALALMFNAALANVPEQQPEPPPESPKPTPKAQPRPYDPTLHPLAHRVVAE